MGIELEPQGTDEDGWTLFRTPLGDIVRFRTHPDGRIDVRFPKDKYKLREVYNVESTGDVVIDLVPIPDAPKS